MGAWGIGNFENDDAADWLCDLEEIKDKSLIYKSLNAILENNEYLEAPECCEALAAAEVIYFGISSERNGASDKILKWLNTKPGLFRKPITFESKDARKAIDVINKILSSSELKELWEESDEFDEWKNIQNKLIGQLRKYA